MELNTSPKKILVAVRSSDLPLVSRILGAEFDIVFCHTLAEANARLDEHIALIACGVHFDDGNMFKFLSSAKAKSQTAAVPFFLLMDSERGYSQAIMNGIRSAAILLGANGFTDLTHLKNARGEEQVYEMLRQRVRETIANA